MLADLGKLTKRGLEKMNQKKNKRELGFSCKTDGTKNVWAEL